MGVEIREQHRDRPVRGGTGVTFVLVVLAAGGCKARAHCRKGGGIRNGAAGALSDADLEAEA